MTASTAIDESYRRCERSEAIQLAATMDCFVALLLAMTESGVHSSGTFWRQFFSRYPVLKIHHTVTMQRPRNASVMPRLKVTLTSEIS
jgi:hypothetical protein